MVLVACESSLCSHSWTHLHLADGMARTAASKTGSPACFPQTLIHVGYYECFWAWVSGRQRDVHPTPGYFLNQPPPPPCGPIFKHNPVLWSVL